MFKIPFACLIVSILTACVGVTTVTHSVKGSERKIAHGIGDRIGEYSDSNIMTRSHNGGILTKNDVQQRWGNPERQFNESGREYWAYHYNLAWRGIVVWLVFPVPLLVPVGYNETIVEFNGDNVTRWWNEEGMGGRLACLPNADYGPMIQCRVSDHHRAANW